MQAIRRMMATPRSTGAEVLAWAYTAGKAPWFKMPTRAPPHAPASEVSPVPGVTP